MAPDLESFAFDLARRPLLTITDSSVFPINHFPRVPDDQVVQRGNNMTGLDVHLNILCDLSYFRMSASLRIMDSRIISGFCNFIFLHYDVTKTLSQALST
jgi:hypothetical protein